MATIDLEEARRITSEKEKQYGLPADTLWKMGGIESGFNGAAVSPKGARGYFQFMEPTAKSYGVTVGDFVSEADGAARYMQDNLKRYQGDMDLALADYNGGPRAAKALAQGKPYAETAGYLAKFYGDKYSKKPNAGGELSKQFTTGQEITPQYGGPSASVLVRDANIAKENQGSFLADVPEAVRLGFQVNNSVINFYKDVAASRDDPNFTWDKGRADKYLTGVPEDNWGYLLQASSDSEAVHRLGRLKENQEALQRLSQMGLSANLTGQLMGGLVDLPSLIAFVPGMGGASLLTKAGRVANAARMGALGAVTNVGIEAATAPYRPTATTDDLYWAALMGLGLGAIGGAAVNPAKLGGKALAAENKAIQDIGLRRADEVHNAELRAAGLAPTKEKATVPRSVVDDGAHLRVREEQVSVRTGMPTEAAPGSVRSRLTAAADSTQDPQLRAAATHLDSVIGDDIKIKEISGGGRSHFDPNTNTIHLRKDAQPWEQVHEIAHAATSQKITYGMANPNTAHGQIVGELQELLKEARVRAQAEGLKDSKSQHYLKDLHEFTAGVFSGDSEFTRFLAKVKPEGADQGSFLSRVVDSFRKILGIAPDETNGLTKALGLSDELMQTAVGAEQRVLSNRPLPVNLAPAEGVNVAPDVVEAVRESGMTSVVYGVGLGLEHRLLGEKVLPGVRSLSEKLIGTTVGYRDHAVVKANAAGMAEELSGSWQTKLAKGAEMEFAPYFENHAKGRLSKSEAYEEFGDKIYDFVIGVDATYPPEVIKAGTTIRGLMNEARENINNPALREGGVKRGLTEVETIDPVSGEKVLTGALNENPNYLPRKHDATKWNTMVTNYGRDAVEGFFARAHQAARPTLSDAAAAKFGKWYVNAVEDAHANPRGESVSSMLQGVDRDGLKDSLMRQGAYTEAEALSIMEDILPVASKSKDAGRLQASLKHRNTLDERFTETWTLPDGEAITVSLKDFVESNALELSRGYLRQTGGNVALARHADVYKVSDIEKVVGEAVRNEFGANHVNINTINIQRKDLEFVFDRIRGIPQEDMTGFSKSAEMWRNFNVITKMGGAVWSQSNEMAMVTGTMGWKASMQAMSELRGLVRDIKTGKAPHDLLDQLENVMGGSGAEFITRMEYRPKDDWVRLKGDTAMNQRLDALDNALRKGSSKILEVTGMTPLMIQQKRIHGIALVNHWVNTANGDASKVLTKNRLAWMGLNEEDFQRIKTALRENSTTTQGKYAKTSKVDWEGFRKSDPEALSKFYTAIHRETRRVIQENDLASMIPVMGTTVGKLVFQFMTFPLHAWNKSMLFAMNHRDAATLSTVIHGSLFASLAYLGRTQLDSLGMSEDQREAFLEQRLSTKQIVASSFGRISQASMLPNIFDTLSPWPMFSGMRTTSDLSGLTANPTYGVINNLLTLGKHVAKAGTDDEYSITQADMRNFARMLPLNNVMPISAVYNSIADDFPINSSGSR